MTEARVIILGAGGHGREVESYVRALEREGEKVSLVGVVDDVKPSGPWGTTQILGDFGALEQFVSRRAESRFQYITAVGNNAARQHLVEAVDALGVSNLKPWSLRHPRALVGPDVVVGTGTCLAPGSVITTRVRLGRHCIVNVNVSVSHDTQIGDWVNINPGAVVCGNVRIGAGCYIGAGATISDGISIGEWTILGAGAVVVDDLPSRVTAVGVPARVIKRHEPR